MMEEEESAARDHVCADELEGARILIVDDEEHNVRLLHRILERAGFQNLASTTDPREVLRLFGEEQPDLILLDLRMPHLDGFAVLDLLRPRIPPRAYLPVLVLTAEISDELKQRALAAGANDFVTKPFDIVEVLLRIRNLLKTRALHVALAGHNELLEERVRERTEDLWEAVQRLTESEQATRTATEETIHRLAAAAELRDEETGWHIERVSRYTALIAGRLGMDRERSELVRLAASMHDIGKIGVPDAILRKRGKLTSAEREEIQRHAEVGYRILAGSKAEVVEMAATIALAHHERFDGGGYPRGLAGKQIPLEGRIAAIADVFDALASDRPYRRALPLGQVLDVLRAESGRHFDPELLEIFLGSQDDVIAIWEAYSDVAMTSRSPGQGRRRLIS